jgi:5-methylcytosine-specific restriction endonuclease McrA
MIPMYNPTVGRAASRRWREKNKDKHRAYCRLWQIENAEAKRQHDKRYKDSHPEKQRQHKHARRARERDAEGEFTASEWSALKEKYENRCALCGSEEKLTIDHIVPLAKGGSNYISNIQPLCGRCNRTKGTKTEW